MLRRRFVTRICVKLVVINSKVDADLRVILLHLGCDPLLCLNNQGAISVVHGRPPKPYTLAAARSQTAHRIRIEDNHYRQDVFYQTNTRVGFGPYLRDKPTLQLCQETNCTQLIHQSFSRRIARFRAVKLSGCPNVGHLGRTAALNS